MNQDLHLYLSLQRVSMEFCAVRILTNSRKCPHPHPRGYTPGSRSPWAHKACLSMRTEDSNLDKDASPPLRKQDRTCEAVISLFLFPRFNLATEKGTSQRKSEQTEEKLKIGRLCLLNTFSLLSFHTLRKAVLQTQTKKEFQFLMSQPRKERIRAAPAKEHK